jgi:hypothetical protein
VQAAGLRGQPVQEPVRAAAGVGADKHLAPQVARQLRQRQPGSLDMVSRRVRPGTPRPQHDGQRLPGPVRAVVGAAKLTEAKGGCPLGSLGGQLAESDPEARALIAAGFDQWAATIRDALRSLHADGKLPPEIDPEDHATTLLATLQGGLLLAQVHRSARPFETAVDTLLALAIGR